MSAGLIATAVVAHTPRIGIEENAPPFQHGLISGLRDLGRDLRAMKPDLFVLQSAHWVSTFNWYVTAHAVHEGVCIADEAPDLIPGVPYRRAGDPAFARALAAAMREGGVPGNATDSEHLHWDYATYVPLKYLDPDAVVPAVMLPTVICSDLTENRRVARIVHQTAMAQGKRVVFLSSCALSHAVERGPERWPTPERIDLDRRFIELATAGQVRELLDWSPVYCHAAVAEMGGRTISGMLGAAEVLALEHGAVTGRQYGDYAQSSGSGNANICLTPAA